MQLLCFMRKAIERVNTSTAVMSCKRLLSTSSTSSVDKVNNSKESESKPSNNDTRKLSSQADMKNDYLELHTDNKTKALPSVGKYLCKADKDETDDSKQLEKCGRKAEFVETKITETLDCAVSGFKFNSNGSKSPVAEVSTAESVKKRVKQKRQRVNSFPETEGGTQKTSSTCLSSPPTVDKKLRKLHKTSRGEHTLTLGKVTGVPAGHFQVTVPCKTNKSDSGLIPAVSELFERFQGKEVLNMATVFADLGLENKSMPVEEVDIIKLENQQTENDWTETGSFVSNCGTNNSNTQALKHAHLPGDRGKFSTLQIVKESNVNRVIEPIPKVKQENVPPKKVFESKQAIKHNSQTCFVYSSESSTLFGDCKFENETPHTAQHNMFSSQDSAFNYNHDSSSIMLHPSYSQSHNNVDADQPFKIEPTYSGAGYQEEPLKNRFQSTVQNSNNLVLNSNFLRSEPVQSAHTVCPPWQTQFSYTVQDYINFWLLNAMTPCFPYGGWTGNYIHHPLGAWNADNVETPLHLSGQSSQAPWMLRPSNISTYRPTFGIPYDYRPLQQAYQTWQHQPSATPNIHDGPSLQLDLSDNSPCPELTDTLRQWKQIKQISAGGPGMTFSVMSYNILAQDLLEMHTDLYSRCSKHDLAWPRRGAAIIRQIISHDADVVCLQEVQANHWKHDIRPVLNSHGYYGVYKKRVGDKPDGCAILYKQNKFTHLKFIPVPFQQGGILDRDNVGIILLLQPNKQAYRTSTKICVATTHLLFNPRRGDVKLAQLMMFLAEIDKVAAFDVESGEETVKSSGCKAGSGKRKFKGTEDLREYKSRQKCGSSAQCRDSDGWQTVQPRGVNGTNKITADDSRNDPHKPLADGERALPPQRYCPIILCGDFNTEPFCDMYQFITRGQLKYQGLVPRLICGQAEGRDSGSNVRLGLDLLPSHLEITESCQYIKVLIERHKRWEKCKSSAGSGGRTNRGDKQSKEAKVNNSEKHRRARDEKRHSRDRARDERRSKYGDSPSDQHRQSSSERASKRKERKSPKNHRSGHRDRESDRDRLEDGQAVCWSEQQDQREESSFTTPRVNSGLAYHAMNFKSVYTHVTDRLGPSGKPLGEVSSQHDKSSCTVDYIFYSSPSASSCPGGTFNADQGLQSKGKPASHLSQGTCDRKDNKSPDTRPHHRDSHYWQPAQSSAQGEHGAEALSNKTNPVCSEPGPQLELVARYSLLTRDQTARHGHLPNATFPSDHLCLIANFLLR